MYLNKHALFRIPFLLLPPSGTFPLEFSKLWFKCIISNFKNVTIISIVIEYINISFISDSWSRHRKTLYTNFQKQILKNLKFWPPSWIRHFEFPKSEFIFVINDLKSPCIPIFKNKFKKMFLFDTPFFSVRKGIRTYMGCYVESFLKYLIEKKKGTWVRIYVTTLCGRLHSQNF